MSTALLQGNTSSETEKHEARAAGKRKAKKKGSKKQKKRRISKHALKAQDKAREEGALTTVSADRQQNQPCENLKIKDPADASDYLTKWKNLQSALSTAGNNSDTPGWKFNKNTQSWLIRHMYEVDKVPKATFSLLLEYLEGLKGDKIKKRMLADASRRAVRYKEHERSIGTNEGDKVSENGSKAEVPTASIHRDTSEHFEEDTARWDKLDDHDKRKEYKRARRILDSFASKQK